MEVNELVALVSTLEQDVAASLLEQQGEGDETDEGRRVKAKGEDSVGQGHVLFVHEAALALVLVELQRSVDVYRFYADDTELHTTEMQ